MARKTLDDLNGRRKPAAIHTRSTSATSADVIEPVVLRETATTRRIFRPKLVENPRNSAASVDGAIVHQRKRPRGAWEDYSAFPLTTLKDSEWIKLELHADEVLRLFGALESLYSIAAEHGVPLGERQFVELDANLRGLLRQPDVADRLLSDQELDLVGAFARWLSANPEEAIERLCAEVSEDDLGAFDLLLGAARLRQFYEEFRASAKNESEGFWQDLFKRNSWVLARVFSHPFVLVQDQAYIGGKRITNKGGNLVDFLYANKLTGNLLVVEIKTPRTRLLESESPYRNNVYPIHRDVVAAITQALSNRRSLMERYKNLREEDDQWAPFSPKCLVVAGSVKLEAMSVEEKSSFELFRNQLRDVDVVAYDELDEQLKTLMALMTP